MQVNKIVKHKIKINHNNNNFNNLLIINKILKLKINLYRMMNKQVSKMSKVNKNSHKIDNNKILKY